MLGGHPPAVHRWVGKFIKAQPSEGVVGGPESPDLIRRMLESGKFTSETWLPLSLWASYCSHASVYTSVRWD